jgi:LysM repeat protein
MNSPSPLIPQGSNLEQQNRARKSLRMKIFCALGVNVVVLLVLLMQGCKREQPPQPPEPTPAFTDTNPPPDVVTDTNVPTAAVADTNAVPTQPVVEPTATAPTGQQEYAIQKGDTFSTIAPKFNVTVKALQAANPNVDPTKLQIGKKIIIPAATGNGTAAAAATVVDVASGETTYTVKSGDTLGKLATEFHTTVKAIQSANGLTDTRIKVGQKLKIPAKTAATP